MPGMATCSGDERVCIVNFVAHAIAGIQILRVLIIEDEALLREDLAQRLQADGHVVEQAASGTEGRFYGEEYPIDCAIVDLGLPDIGGMEIIQHWRDAGYDFPVLILTARGSWQDKVEGLHSGADDYLVKPFHYEELQARLNALLRRAGGWADSVLRCGPLRIDTTTQQVYLRDEESRLTAFEYRLLEYLALHAGQVISKSVLTEHLYADDDERDSNVLEVLIGRLRRKLDPDQEYHLIETLRGRGYRISCDRPA